MRKKVIIAIVLMAAVGMARGQWAMPVESDSSRVAYGVSLGSTVASGFGRTESLSWVAPRVTYKATDRLTVGGGFVAMGSLLGNYHLQGREPMHLSSRHDGTRVVAMQVGARYQVDENLWLWASVVHVGGWVQPLWMPDGHAIDLNATAVSGGFGYRFDNGSAFELHFTFVNDRTGGLFPLTMGWCPEHPLWGDIYW